MNKGKLYDETVKLFDALPVNLVKFCPPEHAFEEAKQLCTSNVSTQASGDDGMGGGLSGSISTLQDLKKFNISPEQVKPTSFSNVI